MRLLLTFDDVMEFAMALLSLSPADRKRLLDHFLASSGVAQGARPEHQPTMPIELAVPQRDVDRLQRFARRELPKAASNAAMLDRVLTALNTASHRQPSVRDGQW